MQKNVDVKNGGMVRFVLREIKKMPRARHSGKRALVPEVRKFKCCLCDREFKGHGHNPQPIKSEGECCNYCNTMKVIPERLRRFEVKNKFGGNS